MKTTTFLVSVSAAVLVATSALADDWFTPTRIELRVGALLRRDFSAVTMVNSANGDVKINVANSEQGKTSSGEMFLIGGHILLAKDVELSPGAEIDAIDAPVLQVQLALKLLAKTIASGPASIRGARDVHFSETKEPLEVSTSSASGAYPPPWSVTGSVDRLGPGRVAFKLNFNFKDAQQPITLSGTWERTSPAPLFPDSLSIVAFRAFTLGPYSKQDAGGTIYDYGAQEISQKFKTLGEARAAARKAAPNSG